MPLGTIGPYIHFSSRSPLGSSGYSAGSVRTRRCLHRLRYRSSREQRDTLLSVTSPALSDTCILAPGSEAVGSCDSTLYFPTFLVAADIVSRLGRNACMLAPREPTSTRKCPSHCRKADRFYCATVHCRVRGSSDLHHLSIPGRPEHDGVVAGQTASSAAVHPIPLGLIVIRGNRTASSVYTKWISREHIRPEASEPQRDQLQPGESICPKPFTRHSKAIKHRTWPP